MTLCQLLELLSLYFLKVTFSIDLSTKMLLYPELHVYHLNLLDLTAPPESHNESG